MDKDWIIFALTLGMLNGVLLSFLNIEGTLFWVFVLGVAFGGNALYALNKAIDENN